MNKPRDIGFSVVDPQEAQLNPYPFVYVTKEGGFRELTEEEKEELETRFSPADGARPYVKSNYREKDGWGCISGYLKRKSLPHGMKDGHPPRKLAFWQGWL